MKTILQTLCFFSLTKAGDSFRLLHLLNGKQPYPHSSKDIFCTIPGSTCTSSTRSTISNRFCLHDSPLPDNGEDGEDYDDVVETTSTKNSVAAAATNSALERTKNHLERLQTLHQQQTMMTMISSSSNPVAASSTLSSSTLSSSTTSSSSSLDPLGLERERLFRQYVQQPAQTLKDECKKRKLPRDGRKPDLARRLAAHDLQQKFDDDDSSQHDSDDSTTSTTIIREATATATTVKDSFPEDSDSTLSSRNSYVLTHFASLKLSSVASIALSRAGFIEPSPIQAAAIPYLAQQQRHLLPVDNKQGQQQHRKASSSSSTTTTATTTTTASAILHAETGSGKTLAYLLPLTERFWKQQQQQQQDGQSTVAVVLTPTRELAAQVAGIAQVLSPPGTVRLVTHPTNLFKKNSDDSSSSSSFNGMMPRLYIGSAKSLYQSLFGDGRMPAAPTPKPLALHFLQQVRYLVLDEVDRLLAVTHNNNKAGPQDNNDLQGRQQQQTQTTTNANNNNNKRKAKKMIHQHQHYHEKPAAILTAAVARHSLGRAQVVAASATVGRPLRRELARVMGLTPDQCPPVIRANEEQQEEEGNVLDDSTRSSSSSTGPTTTSSTTRAVTIPASVQHYIFTVPDASPGTILTHAYQVIQKLSSSSSSSSSLLPPNKMKKILLVLTRGFGISTANAVGALQHFGCRPQPQSLLDALQAASSTTTGTTSTTTTTTTLESGSSLWLIEKHRQVTGSVGLGEAAAPTSNLSSSTTPQGVGGDDDDARIDEDRSHQDGYLLVTGEDTVRGLHLDGLDIVMIAGRPLGVDEYTHIAGRTGRAGKTGKVITLVENAAPLRSWEKMLQCSFDIVGLEDIADKLA